MSSEFVVTLAISLFVWLTKQVVHFYNWLGTLLPAKIMFVVFGASFSVCAGVEVQALSAPFVLEQARIIYQWAALTLFSVALLMCCCSLLITVGDGIIKYRTRMRVVFVDHFSPNNY